MITLIVNVFLGLLVLYLGISVVRLADKVGRIERRLDELGRQAHIHGTVTVVDQSANRGRYQPFRPGPKL